MSKEKRTDNTKKEQLSKEELLELMGVHLPVYKKVKGRVRQQ